MTYTEAIEELEAIVQEIEMSEITVDLLGDKVKRAAELIRFCRKTLYDTGQDVESIMKELKEGMKNPS